jgi:beta-N-acetylhexosaminidase
VTHRHPPGTVRIACGLALSAVLAAGCASAATTATTPPTVTTAGSPASTEPATTATADGAAPTATAPSRTTTTADSTSTTAPATTTTAEEADPAVIGRLAAAVMLVSLQGPYLDEDATAHLAAGGRSVLVSAAVDRLQVRALSSDAACTAGDPVIVAIEQDLGQPPRIAGLAAALPGVEEARSMGPGPVAAAARSFGDGLQSLGINLNLAPAVDVAAGDDPRLVAGIGAAFVGGLGESGVGAAPGHFPGTGRADGGAVIGVTLDDLVARDLVPFEAAVDAGAPVVIVAATLFPAVDPGVPANRSPVVLALLRDSLGFGGVALGEAEGGAAAVDALAAGIDLLLVGDGAAAGRVAPEIAAAVEEGRLPFGRLAEAAGRVERLASSLARIPCVTDG